MMPDDSQPKRIKPIAVELMPQQIFIRFNGQKIANSIASLVMLEPGHGLVFCFPRSDVQMDLFKRTDHYLHCSHKGDASYWTVTAGDMQAENAAWG
jgi:uncharacterized protein (DUF427 family)